MNLTKFVIIKHPNRDQEHRLKHVLPCVGVGVNGAGYSAIGGGVNTSMLRNSFTSGPNVM
jgi:hypothetical protein